MLSNFVCTRIRGSYSATSGRLAHTTSSGTSSCHKVYLSQTYAGAVLAAPNNTETEDNTIWSDGSYVDFVGFDLSSSNCDAIYSTGTYTNFIYNSVHDVGNNATVVSSGNCASKGGGAGLAVGGGASPTAATGDKVLNNIVWNVGYSGDVWIHGIYITGPNITVENNVVYNVSGGCIQAYHYPSNDIISNNTLVDCKWGYVVGAASGYAASNIVFNNNIVAGNTQYGIYECGASSCGVAMGSKNTYSNNITYSNTDSNQMEGGTLVNNLTSNPELMEVASPASGGNFAVESGSPAIGAGTTSEAPSTDILGLPLGSSVTIGAYQQ